VKIISYNLNGIRSAIKKDWLNWLESTGADVVCLQEIKATPEQIDVKVFEKMGYHHFWFPAEKKGYSGVAILSKKKPIHVEYGIGIKKYDSEGRIIRAGFSDCSVMNVYFPSGTMGDARQEFKYEFMDDFQKYINLLKKEHPKIILSGDVNICHKLIDIHNPVSNANSSGFLPEEREWLDKFLQSGWIDTFRHFNKEPHHYTWWSYRARAREKNLGWRLDYHLSTLPLEKNLKRSVILPEARHSDHCPILLETEG